jgi:predicted RNase H-like nuclease (RuvC/YqgF family)
MDEGFELLEEKVRKAAELVRRLRGENTRLEDDLGRARARLQAAEKKLSSLESGPDAPAADKKAAEVLGQEVSGLRREREEIKRRIAKLVEVLDSLD